MDVQRGSRAVPVSPPPRTVLTIDETAALLRVDRQQVAASIERRQLQVITHDGATLVDGDALWVRLDPLATQLPRQLTEALAR